MRIALANQFTETLFSLDLNSTNLEPLLELFHEQEGQGLVAYYQSTFRLAEVFSPTRYAYIRQR